jgi:CheY-like chemotaxis protein
MEGTGLGLSISQRLVKMMGGTLEIESTPNKGTIFWFEITLPHLADVTNTFKSSQRDIIGFSGRQQSILVVDDKLENRVLLRDWLISMGFKVIEAENGQEAVQQATQYIPNLILMDVRMPIMDGLEATQQIHQIPALVDTPIIAISASTFEKDYHQSLQAGCQSFIAKPINFDQLLDQFQTHLDLNWIYRTEDEGNTTSFQEDIGEDWAIPPENELEQLLILVRRGDVKRVKQRLKELENNQQPYQPFLSSLYTLAEQYQLKKLRSLLETYVNPENN